MLEHVEEEFENHMEDLIKPSYEIGDNATCGIAIMFFWWYAYFDNKVFAST